MFICIHHVPGTHLIVCKSSNIYWCFSSRSFMYQYMQIQQHQRHDSTTEHCTITCPLFFTHISVMSYWYWFHPNWGLWDCWLIKVGSGMSFLSHNVIYIYFHMPCSRDASYSSWVTHPILILGFFGVKICMTCKLSIWTGYLATSLVQCESAWQLCFPTAK